MRRWLIFILLAIIAIKVAVLLARGPAAIDADAQHYWELSTAVGQGDVLLFSEPIAYRMPIYPWLLAIMRFMPSPLLLLAIVQGAMYVGSVWMAASLSARISRFKSARIFTLLILLPAVSAINFVATALPETMLVFFLMLNLVTVLDYTKYQTSTRAALLGLTFALTLSTRPAMMLLWVAHVLFVLAIHYRRKYRQGNHIPVSLYHRAGHAGVAAVVVIVILLPWFGRNLSLFGQPCLTQSIGRSLWAVTFERGSGAGLSLAPTQITQRFQLRLVDTESPKDWRNGAWRNQKSVSDALVEMGISDVEADRMMREVALEAIETDPPQVLYKFAERSIEFWIGVSTRSYPPRPHYKGFDDYPPTWSLHVPLVTTLANKMFDYRITQWTWMNIVVTLVIIGACCFLLFHWPTRPFGIWVSLMLAYICVVTGALEMPDYRFRIVIEPMAAMAVGSMLAVLWARWHEQEPELELELEVDA